jgi:hypothetical protein
MFCKAKLLNSDSLSSCTASPTWRTEYSWCKRMKPEIERLFSQYFPTSHNKVILLLSLPTSHSHGPLAELHLILNNTLQNISHLISEISHLQAVPPNSNPQALSSNSNTIRISKIIFLYKLTLLLSFGIAFEKKFLSLVMNVTNLIFNLRWITF